MALTSEMKIEILEPLAESNADKVKPPKNAVPQPFTIEPGFPRPEPIYETAASIPIQNGFPIYGSYSIPVIIQKDGSVKVPSRTVFAPRQAVFDALSNAISRWKYKPYLVDGEPVEVGYTVTYLVNGKPFVPSYERPKPVPVTTAPEDYWSAWDPKRDPEKDLTMAMAAAAAGHKRILVDVGGGWCIWCKVLDKFFADHPDLLQLRGENFVLMKVNVSVKNENSAFLSRFPRIPGYPYLFVLDADGKMLLAKNTEDIEDRGGGYSARAVKEFLTAWKPQ
jgi:thiol-disulfide isomerase/thioredoxin